MNKLQQGARGMTPEKSSKSLNLILLLLFLNKLYAQHGACTHSPLRSSMDLGSQAPQKPQFNLTTTLTNKKEFKTEAEIKKKKKSYLRSSFF